ncbi:hypothetical protein EW146_g9588 [Bondarzewia mesenterica]|uniref:Malic acid transport protein n=1 Tax=Bondarzewia mesenterica TaxID=1095465 RepID=A0A4S4L6F9_9AGAM|nr:hypothetical protein EW146_g9588 [Bondarzewia mesenterica]
MSRASTATLTHSPNSPPLDFSPSPSPSPPPARVFPGLERPPSAPSLLVNWIARRVHGWTWQAFSISMGTGAVHITLSEVKHQSSAFTRLQIAFYFIDMVLFLLNTSTLLLQALLYPRQARRLVMDPTNGLYVPLIALSFATIILGTINYGHVGPRFIYILFWVYVALSLFLCMSMLTIWFNKPHDMSQFNPTCAFLIFPMMLTGVVAFNVLDVMDASDVKSLGVLLVGYFFQGLGSFVTSCYICIYFYRIMATGFLDGHQANGAFVNVGPPGFTGLALINLGSHAQGILPAHALVSPLAGEVWYGASVLGGLMLFGLAVFLFVFSALPYWFKVDKQLHSILDCWALTFPNVGWISTLHVLGDTLHIPGFYVVHDVMVVLMCLTWLTLSVFTVLAFWRGEIFMARGEEVVRDSLLGAIKGHHRGQHQDQDQVGVEEGRNHHPRPPGAPRMRANFTLHRLSLRRA